MHCEIILGCHFGVHFGALEIQEELFSTKGVAHFNTRNSTKNRAENRRKAARKKLLTGNARESSRKIEAPLKDKKTRQQTTIHRIEHALRA